MSIGHELTPSERATGGMRLATQLIDLVGRLTLTTSRCQRNHGLVERLRGP